ncbi:MAG: hypothetical protein IJJ73_10760 [Bacteroidaceae bacterium]|nr:hypothetical protein [Bacteroidaceae bacterium]
MEMKEYIMKQVNLLKEAIENGDISKDSPLILEQKELLIDILYDLAISKGIKTEKETIALEVDKIFADELGVE